MTPTPEQQARLYEAICGEYSLRCVEPCPECVKGVDLGCVPHVRDCPTCSGHGVVFRTDDAGRRLIFDAAEEFTKTAECKVWFVATYVAGVVRVGSPMSGRCYQVWDNCTGQPWEAPLKKFVREYRVPCPALMAGDTLFDLLQERGVAFQIYSYGHGYEAIVFTDEDEFPADDSDFRAALFAAAWAAFLPEEK